MVLHCSAVPWIRNYHSKFLDELKAAGADTIIAEKQRQLDDWLEANK